MKQPNVKIQRANADILRVLTVTLREKMQNEHFAGVTILNVETSADYAFTKVFVEIDGNDAEKTKAMSELEKSAGFLRSELASRVKMRQTPQLRFHLDRGRENANRVEELLAQINGNTTK
ncbi:MAG: 30S ribosome-binding factor RbfA [Firmicutes bacterium]|nr:30S ribosome-binding factor RbfA [Bacillota bacterium]